MRQNVLLLAATASLASGSPQYSTSTNPHEWIPGGPDDFRGPCPMLNTLTNHGFLPRDGRNFTKANIVKGLGDGLNFDATLAGIMQLVSRAENANYAFTASTEEFSLGEVAAPIIAFGDTDVGTVKRDLVVYFFENERLPTELGWSKKNTSITLETILGTTAIVRNATSLLTGGAAAPADPHKRRDLHSGFF
ncbi:hypothetical protein E8E11_005107 [Didymella keratinophila]|nr:hypothetical protein E8E11_005107 [Didymella keratinophila]